MKVKNIGNRVYDGVFSLGYNCRCAIFLRDARLRDCSSPFDWLTGATFGQRIDTLVTGFKGFLEEKNLRFVKVEPPPGALVEHDRYDDSTNGFAYLHDFDAGVPMHETFPAVRAKYDRRIARLLGRLDAGGTFLFVWWALEAESDESLLAALAKLRQRFGKADISILAIDNTGGDGVGYSEVEGSEGRITRASGRMLLGQTDMNGDVKRGMSIFRKIRAKGEYARRLRWAIARLIVHLLTWFMPTKAMRRRNKKKLQRILLGKFA